MPSPFPGMDPWLERPRAYADIRFSMVVLLSHTLNAVLPKGYVSRIRHITEEIGSTDAESFVEILAFGSDDDADICLTAIEFPERHRHWRECRAKGAWTAGRMLIRLFRDPWVDPSGPPLGPQIVTRRFGEAERIDVETLDYYRPLPTLAVPWAAGGPDLDVPLQPLLDHVYDSGRYPSWTDYRRPYDPPLTAEQQAWAEGVLRAQGLLPAGGGA